MATLKFSTCKNFDRMFVFLRESFLLMASCSSERCGDYTDLCEAEKKNTLLLLLF
jgi:hypothetical protein